MRFPPAGTTGALNKFKLNPKKKSDSPGQVVQGLELQSMHFVASSPNFPFGQPLLKYIHMEGGQLQDTT